MLVQLKIEVYPNCPQTIPTAPKPHSYLSRDKLHAEIKGFLLCFVCLDLAGPTCTQTLSPQRR